MNKILSITLLLLFIKSCSSSTLTLKSSKIVDRGYYQGVGCQQSIYLSLSDVNGVEPIISVSNVIDTTTTNITTSSFVTARLTTAVYRVDINFKYNNYNNYQLNLTTTTQSLICSVGSIQCTRPPAQSFSGVVVPTYSLSDAKVEFLTVIQVTNYQQTNIYSCQTSTPTKFICFANVTRTPFVSVYITAIVDTTTTGSYNDNITITLTNQQQDTISFNTQPIPELLQLVDITSTNQYPNNTWTAYSTQVYSLATIGVNNPNNIRFLSDVDRTSIIATYPTYGYGDTAYAVYYEVCTPAISAHSIYQLTSTKAVKVMDVNTLINNASSSSFRVLTSDITNLGDKYDVPFQLTDFSKVQFTLQQLYQFTNDGTNNYPFGYYKRSNETYPTYKFTTSPNGASSLSIKTNQYGESLSYLAYSIPKIDLQPPTIKSISFQPYKRNTYFIIISVQDDISGLKNIDWGNNRFGSETRINGTNLDGFYALSLFYSTNTLQLAVLPTIMLTDNSLNSITVDLNSFGIDLNPVPPIQLKYFTIDDITYFRFIPSYMDTSLCGQTCAATLLMNLTNIDPNFIIAVTFKGLVTSSLVRFRNFVWSQNDRMYRVTFPVPMNVGNLTITPQINFLKDIGLEQQIFKKFGQNSVLQTVSSYQDSFPPKIESITAFPSNVVVVTQDTPIGFQLVISDPSGVSAGSVTIQSSIDGSLYMTTLGPASRISGNDTYGVYQCNIKTLQNQNCQSVTYTIVEILLVDAGLNRVIYPPSTKFPLYPSFDPLYLIRQSPSYSITIQTTCSNTTIDTDPPLITSLFLTLVNVTLHNNTAIQINGLLKVTDYGSGINRNVSLPTLTIFSEFNPTYAFATEVRLDDGQNITYGISLSLPLVDSNFLISVQGLVDNNGNIRSYSSLELEQAGFNSSIQARFQIEGPSLTAPTVPLPNENIATVTGFGFGSDLSQLKGFINYNNSGEVDCQILFVNNNVMTYIVTQLTKPYVFRVEQNGMTSNFAYYSLSIPLAPVAIPPDPIICTNQCNGNGDCTFNGCKCRSPWSGPDCSTTTIPVIPPQQNTTDPTVIIIDNGNSSSTSGGNGGSLPVRSIISIYSIRELDIQGTIVNNYQFNNWTVSIQPNQFNSTTNYLYSNRLSTNTVVNVSIQWFEVSTSIPFAGDIIQVTPFTSKFSVSLSPYPFREAFNTLQIIFKTEYIAQGSQCSSKQYGLGNGNDQNDLQWMKLKIDDKSVYGQFIRRGIVDGRNSIVKNVLLDQEFNSNSTSSSTESFIGINIPKYSKSVQLDPSFANLIDVDGGDNSNQVCGNNKSKSGLSNGVIAAIVVASIVAASLVIGSIMLIKKKVVFAKHEKNVNMKLNKM